MYIKRQISQYAANKISRHMHCLCIINFKVFAHCMHTVIKNIMTNVRRYVYLKILCLACSFSYILIGTS